MRGMYFLILCTQCDSSQQGLDSSVANIPEVLLSVTEDEWRLGLGTPLACWSLTAAGHTESRTPILLSQLCPPPPSRRQQETGSEEQLGPGRGLGAAGVYRQKREPQGARL